MAPVKSHRPGPSPGIAAAVILSFFFLSGTSGLIFENLWMRLLRLVMGSTIFAVTTVLCAFMGGLALGSLVGGRLIDRRNDPLRVYALLEGGVGIYCLFLPALIHLANPLYRLIYQDYHASFYLFSILRFLFSGLILLVPTTLMGATLPVLSKFFTRDPDQVGWSVGRIYAINTFGAVLGAFASGFVLIPNLGVRQTIYVACILNFLICAGTLLIRRRTPWPQQTEAVPDSRAERETKITREASKAPSVRTSVPPVAYPPAVWKILLVGYGLSGLAALVYEVAWTKVLSLVIGSSVYAFSLMLTAFILGLATGSMVFSRFIDRSRDPVRLLGVIELGIGFSALATVPFFGYMPFLIARIVTHVESFWLLQWTQFLLLFLAMFIPTLLMGAAFPLVSRIYTRSTTRIGSSIGNVYAANTFGSILGSFGGGFVLIPWLGIQKTIFAAVLLNVVLGCAFLLFGHVPTPARKSLAVALALVVLAVALAAMPSWDQHVMTSGAYLYAKRFVVDTGKSPADFWHEGIKGQVLYHNESLGAAVTVFGGPNGLRSLAVNGKVDASTKGDMSTQILLAQGPMLLHPDPQNVLVIGLASGVTLGSAACHPAKVLDCVEISPIMIEACHFFDDVNHNVLADPRVNVIIEDGRNHLALTGQRYDVIISEPSNPWVAGIGDLFTVEFFELCRRRLNEGGVVCVWLQAYEISEDVFRTVVRTFQHVFPDVFIFESNLMYDYLLVGSPQTVKVSYEALRARVENPPVRADLQRIKINNAAEFLAQIVMNGKQVGHYVGAGTLHTDDNALVEFTTPRSLIRGGSQLWKPLVTRLNASRELDLSFLHAPETLEAELTKVKAQAAAFVRGRRYGLEAVLAMPDLEAALAAGEKAKPLDPLTIACFAEKSQASFVELRSRMRRLAQLTPRQRTETLAISQILVDLVPTYSPEPYVAMAVLLSDQRRYREVSETYRRARNAFPDNVTLINNLAWLLATCPDERFRNGQEALKLANVLAQSPQAQDPTILSTLAAAYAEAAQFTKAINAAQTALARAADAGREDLQAILRKQLESYQAGKPYRDASSR